jgi:hypothetical protein
MGVGIAGLGFGTLLAAFVHVTSELAFIHHSVRLSAQFRGWGKETGSTARRCFLLSVVTRLAEAIQRRTARFWLLVVPLAVLCLCVVAMVLLSKKSHGTLESTTSTVSWIEDILD